MNELFFYLIIELSAPFLGSDNFHNRAPGIQQQSEMQRVVYGNENLTLVKL